MGSDIGLGRVQLSNAGGLAGLNGSGGFDATPNLGQPVTLNGPTIINPALDTQVGLIVNAHSASQTGFAINVRDFANNSNFTVLQYIPDVNPLAAQNTVFVRGQGPRHMTTIVDAYGFHVRFAGRDPGYDPAYVTSTATSGTATTLVDTTKNWTINQYVGYRVKVNSGTGNGDSALITANTATSLTVASWNVATPDNTSGYTINGDASQAEAGQHVSRFHFMNASDPPYNSNYNGPYPTSAGNFQNDSVGTAITPISGGGGEQMNCNSAVMMYSSGSGIGTNVAGIGRAENSPVNIGLLGFSTNFSNVVAQNFGVWGIAQNTIGGATRVGGYFALTNTEPTGFTNSALQCDNFANAANIFTASRNNLARLVIDQYGACTLTPFGQTGGVTALTITPGSYGTVTAEVTDINYNLHTMFVSGAYSNQRFVRFQQPSVSAATAIAVGGTVATVYIDGPPLAIGAGPASFTNGAFPFWVNTGTSRLSALNLNGLISTYNNVATAGWGIPAIYTAGRPAQQTNTTVVLGTYAVTGADGSFEISANINVTVSTTAAMTVTCTYTDEANVARTLQMQFSLLGGTWASSITTAQGNIPYESPVYAIRAKVGTTISIQTAGTVTAITYTGEAFIKQTR